MADLKSIADAIAARYASLTATNGTATETITGTADLPNSVGKLALLIYPPTGTLELDMRRVEDVYEFPVRLLRDPFNVPQRTQWLYSWHNAMRLRVEGNMDLGLSYVAWARAASVRLELGGEQYSAADGTYQAFDVVEHIIRVRIDQVESGLAI